MKNNYAEEKDSESYKSQVKCWFPKGKYQEKITSKDLWKFKFS